MRWVAFLRAVNVGRRTVRMERLRALFSELGYADAATFIASGNVRFGARGDAASLERRIERALLDTFGFEVPTFVRTSGEIAALAVGDPFPAAEGDTLMVGFLTAAPDAAAAARVHALRGADDDFRVVGRELWWRRRGRLSDSKLAAGGLEKCLGAPMTMRNVTTVRKLAALEAGKAGS